MLDFTNLVALAKAAMSSEKNAPVAYTYDGKNFSYDQVNSTLREELNELLGSPAKYRDNKNHKCNHAHCCNYLQEQAMAMLRTLHTRISIIWIYSCKSIVSVSYTLEPVITYHIQRATPSIYSIRNRTIKKVCYTQKSS